MKYKNFCDDDCRHLDPTEEEQDIIGTKHQHFCNKYKKGLMHEGHHPLIPRLEECKIEK